MLTTPEVKGQPAYRSLADLMWAVAEDGCVEGETLFQWLLDQVPDLKEAWSVAERDLGGGLTLLDVVAVRRWACIHPNMAALPEEDRRHRVATTVKLFELHPRTREMWTRIERTARDAGLMAQWPRHAVEAAARHQELAELLAGDDPEPLLTDCRPRRAEAYLAILEHRLHREEGDVERVRRLHDTLRRKLSRVPLKVLPRKTDSDQED